MVSVAVRGDVEVLAAADQDTVAAAVPLAALVTVSQEELDVAVQAQLVETDREPVPPVAAALAEVGLKVAEQDEEASAEAA